MLETRNSRLVNVDDHREGQDFACTVILERLREVRSNFSGHPTNSLVVGSDIDKVLLGIDIAIGEVESFFVSTE